jgi:acetyl-CoA carboxylase biotin carboxylase subunit
VLIKAVAGGGGRGMTIVQGPDELRDALRLARNEARLGFADERVYLEKFLGRPRHIEVQVLADGHGRVVHLGERDCTLQRRHQKVIEEAPSPALGPRDRARIGRVVAEAMRELGYRGLGTVEFLWQDGQFYFIEMNTRLQVEHPVTEMVTGIDLVREQIRVASGEPLGYDQDAVRFTGHAVECRITAEDPATLTPRAGQVTAYHAPGGPGVRVDSALYAGYVVPPYYDSLIAKLIVHDVDREACLRRCERALAETVIDGLPTNIPLLRRLLETEEVERSAFDTNWLSRFLAAQNG